LAKLGKELPRRGAEETGKNAQNFYWERTGKGGKGRAGHGRGERGTFGEKGGFQHDFVRGQLATVAKGAPAVSKS